jgi:hypothetical protein
MTDVLIRRGLIPLRWTNCGLTAFRSYKPLHPEEGSRWWFVPAELTKPHWTSEYIWNCIWSDRLQHRTDAWCEIGRCLIRIHIHPNPAIRSFLSAYHVTYLSDSVTDKESGYARCDGRKLSMRSAAEEMRQPPGTSYVDNVTFSWDHCDSHPLKSQSSAQVNYLARLVRISCCWNNQLISPPK